MEKELFLLLVNYMEIPRYSELFEIAPGVIYTYT